MDLVDHAVIQLVEFDMLYYSVVDQFIAIERERERHGSFL
jgi:hypothetical protein